MVTILTLFSLVFVVPNGTPDYRVFVTKNRWEADLIVYKTINRNETLNKEWFWFITNKRSESKFTVRWVSTRSNADLIVYFTNRRNEAGWKKSHRLIGNLRYR
jgi:hypothetical protein